MIDKMLISNKVLDLNQQSVSSLLGRARQILIVTPYRVNNARQPLDNDLQCRDH